MGPLPAVAPDGIASRRKLSLVPDDAQSCDEESIRFRAIRIVVLVLLTCQNCSLMMVTSYSRSMPGPQYLASTAVVASEVVKTFVVFGVLVYKHGFCSVPGLIWRDILNNANTAKFAVPALFYTVQNNLWYYAMSTLDPVTAAVTSQTKVISTALFSVLILKKQLNLLHWSAIGILILGLTCMQLKQSVASASADSNLVSLKTPIGPARIIGTTNDRVLSEYYLGLLSMLAACTSSGYAGVYLERLFKELDSSVWISNMQLQFFCLPIAVCTMLSDLGELHRDGLFSGWNATTRLVVVLNALGGFIVSLTMKYADNILKTFAVSMSLVGNLILSWLFLSEHISMQDILGLIIVIGGTWLYNLGSTSAGRELHYCAVSQGSTSHVAPSEACGDTSSGADFELNAPIVFGRTSSEAPRDGEQ